ncbi:hypothetical protein D3C87_1510170 [compost metagenome]
MLDPVGAKLARDSALKIAIAGKPCSYRSATTAAHCSAVTGITDSREPFCTNGISASAVCCFK